MMFPRTLWTRIARLQLPAMLSLLVPGCLWAQSGSPESARQAACERSRNKMAARATGEDFRRAVVNVQSCSPDEAAEALANAWNSAPQDTAALRLLGEVGGRVADRRVLAAALQVAGNTGGSLQERLAAFRTLAAYAVPGTVLLYHDLDRTNLPGVGYVMIGSNEHQDVIQGSQRLGKAEIGQILDTFRRLGRSDPNTTVKAVAAHLAERLATSS